jgi:hypothetical protein
MSMADGFQSDNDQPAATMLEVTYALMLTRLIEDVNADPALLRAAVYDSARHKLRDQVADRDPREARRAIKAMETAIQGVEIFAQRQNRGAASDTKLIESSSERSQVAAPRLVSDESRARATILPSSTLRPIVAHHSAPTELFVPSRSQRRRKLAFLLVPSVLVAATIGATIFVANRLHQNPDLAMPPKALPATSVATRIDALMPNAASAILTSPTAAQSASQTVRLPANFGIFAATASEFYELDPMAERPPDSRVAMSAAITRPAKTTIPDGRIRFIVYRRDLTASVDRAEVRIMAQIARDITFEGGKPTVTPQADSWVIRNISFPYRAAPVKDNADMYELRSEAPDFALSPGRYVLVLKGVAYDFSVSGTSTDPKHCLERLGAANGTFYSECQN